MISAVIITKNEARNIKRCLDSLEGVADEIIVVDSGSTDDTASICRDHGVRWIEHEWIGYAATKNFANSQASHSYILSMDADEALSEELTASILAVKPHLKGAYEFNRLTNYCGQWIRHCGWYPDKKIRLFPQKTTHWAGPKVHEELVLDSTLPITHLKGDLHHYTVYSIDEHYERIQSYAELGAAQMHEEGRKANWIKGMLSPLWRFFHMYVIKGGWKEGYYGWVICRISAYAVYLRNKELRKIIDRT